MKLSPVSFTPLVILAGIAMPACAAFASQAPKQPKTYEIAQATIGIGILQSRTMNACAHDTSHATVINSGAVDHTAHEGTSGTVTHNGTVTAMHCGKGKGNGKGKPDKGKGLMQRPGQTEDVQPSPKPK